MDVGDSGATKGMSKSIYDGLHAVLYPKLTPPPPSPDMKAEDKKTIDDNWRPLAFAVATGVVNALSAAPSGTAVAQVVSTSADDTAFWAWLAGFAGVFNTWASSAAPTVVTLQTSLKTFFQSNPVPTSLNGSLK